jgi:hypothetical protein
MSRIRTEELLDRITKGNFKTIKLKALQSNSFVIMLEGEDGTFIHEGSDGNMKEYPKVDHALTWLKRMTNLNEIIIDIGLSRNDA